MRLSWLTDPIEARYPGLVLEVWPGTRALGDAPVWELASIVVPKPARNRGIGSAVMDELTAAADRHGAVLLLTPSRSFGATSVARLRRFYGRFGFVRNLGRRARHEWSGTMYRLPRARR